MITYLDRVCIASAAPEMVKVLGLNSVADLKLAFTAFAFAYAAFEIPSGWLGDVYGPRNVLIRIVLWWSVFTALTGATGLSIGGLFVGLGGSSSPFVSSSASAKPAPIPTLRGAAQLVPLRRTRFRPGERLDGRVG